MKQIHTAALDAAIKEIEVAVRKPIRAAQDAMRPFEIVDEPMLLPSARIHNELARIEKILHNDLPELVREMEVAYEIWLQSQPAAVPGDKNV